MWHMDRGIPTVERRHTNCMAIKMEIFMHWLNFEA